jgi:hypothetical protein
MERSGIPKIGKTSFLKKIEIKAAKTRDKASLHQTTKIGST